MRAATPATVLVLAATIIMVLVTCSTPVIKSLAFLEATIGGQGNQSGQKARLGCLGYCIGDTCKGPTVGYSFDPTQLLGIATSVEGFSVDSSKYSSAVIKGLTYALVLNPIALAACVLTLLTGLLAHCGDMSLICINGVMSGLASSLAFIAAAVNFALFILAQKRINAINGASASLGTALWLSLAGWILIVMSSCAFCCGCGGRGGGGRRRKSMRDEQNDDAWKAPSGGLGGGGRSNYADSMRMDALQAESDRKRRQKDLPKFATYETEHVEELPLKQDYDDSFAQHSVSRHGGNGYGQPGGYGYGYGDESSFSHSAGPAYIAGVGTGALRGPQPAVNAYYDPATSSQNNLAGHGAHNLTSPTGTEPPRDTYGSAMGTPMGMPEPVGAAGHGDRNDYFYGDTAGPHPVQADAYGYDDGYGGHLQQQQQHGQAGYPYDPSYHEHQDQGASVAGYSAYGGHDAAADQGHSFAPSTQQNHAYDYSGATFGGGHAGQSRAVSNIGRAASSASHSPYDAVQQASAAGRSRRLPSVPATDPAEIPYSPTSPTPTPSVRHNQGGLSFGAGHIPPPGQVTGDDGFGVAVLQAGAAQAANSRAGDHHDNYGHAGPSVNAADQYGIAHHQHSDSIPSEAPPGYSPHEADAYGGMASRSGYGNEKR